MCTLALFYRTLPGLPLLIAANRDEFLDRPSSEPAALCSDPWVVAGQDLSAGGTWLGLNQLGMVVGVLNKRGPDQVVDPHRRSRGLLCLEALQAGDPTAARALLAGAPASRYNGFNLLVATAGECFVATTRGASIELVDLQPGVHLLTNLEVNDPTCPRIAKSHRLFAALSSPDETAIDAYLPPLRALLSDHSTALDPRSGRIENLCVHRGPYGTRSSSIIALPSECPWRYWHAPGPPCATEYCTVALPPR
jgi:uncharacterized protein with NRDE domain